MTAALFDTNIIIDALNGREAAAAELLAYSDAAISIITWIEVLTGMPAAVRPEVEQFLADAALTVVSLTGAISAETVRIRYAALH
ncbi:PIN domain-containing protein [Pseudoduganella aquatica]|uniref:PIN domain-containing protein n=1 Tax=Pseudoduganella aquatica TaxID=2660641 RepID=UPI001E45E092|nr:PIN domain-containing protein [Pseudoduganella aquatica]